MDLHQKPQDPDKILRTDFLDLLFEGRNKTYGAYELRKTYNKRITSALLITAGIGVLIFLSSFLAKQFDDPNAKLEVKEVELENIVEEKKDEPPPPPPPPKPIEPPKVEMTKFTPPQIVKDEEVKKEDIPPEMEKLEDTKIDVVSQEGIKDEGLAAPPVDEGKGVVEAPKEDPDKVFEKVEIEAKVDPGAWRRHLERNLQRYIEDAASQGMTPGTYTIQVKFLVERDGTITDVRSLTDPGHGLGKGAEDVVKKGPKWSPGIQNGKEVRSYHTQPITFVVQEGE